MNLPRFTGPALLSALAPVLAPVLALAVLPAGIAQAQSLENLEDRDEQFFDGLRQRHLTEVLDFYIQAYPAKDEMAQKLRTILSARTVSEDAWRQWQVATTEAERNRLQAAAWAAEERVIAAMAERLKLVEGNNKYLVDAYFWGSQLSEEILARALVSYSARALDTYEYGAPDASQRAAVEKLMPQALLVTQFSRRRMDDIVRNLAADAGFRDKVLRDGYSFLIQEHKALQSKYYFAMAAMAMTLLPDSHPYYANLGKDPAFPNQAATPEEERKRLAKMAKDAVDSVATDHALPEETRDKAAYVLGRALTRLGKYPQAETECFKPLITDASQRWDGVLALAAMGRGMAFAGKPVEGALFIRDNIDNSSHVRQAFEQGDIYPYLFLADAAHRILREVADKETDPAKKQAALDRAYGDPYGRVLSEERLTPVRNALFLRWEKEFKDMPDRMKPAAVSAGIALVVLGEVSGKDGLVEQTERAFQDSIQSGEFKPTPEYQKLAGELQPKLERARAEVLRFTGAGGSESGRAQALHVAALSEFMAARAGIGLVQEAVPVDPMSQTAHAAALHWLAIAAELPAQPQAAEAMSASMYLLHRLHTDGKYADDYVKAATLLFTDKYKGLPAAQNEAVYFADRILLPAGKNAEATKVLALVLPDHETYWYALQKTVQAYDGAARRLVQQREALRAAGKDAEAKAMDPQVQAAWEALKSSAAGVVIAAANVTGQARESALIARAAASLALAKAQAGLGNENLALRALEKFETEFSPDQIKGDPQEPRVAALKAALASMSDSVGAFRLRLQVEAGQLNEFRAASATLLAGDSEKALNLVKAIVRDFRNETMSLRDLAETASGSMRAQYEDRRRRYGSALLTLTELLTQKLAASSSAEQRQWLDLLKLQALAASGNTKDAVVEADRLTKEAEARKTADGKPGRPTLGLLMATAIVKYEHALTLSKTDPERIKLLNDCSEKFSNVIKAFVQKQNRPAEYWEAYYYRFAAAVAADSKTVGDIPRIIGQLKDKDPTLGGEPWAERIERLGLRVQAGGK